MRVNEMAPEIHPDVRKPLRRGQRLPSGITRDHAIRLRPGRSSKAANIPNALDRLLAIRELAMVQL
ncbi:MAG: hypothetical protein KatS3mg110_4488 [Pirellulaceae bacterium]|nr:MAG: hypothetical protein KatS3mg110_4488 [Pirellulaceae bacterium]